MQLIAISLDELKNLDNLENYSLSELVWLLFRLQESGIIPPTRDKKSHILIDIENIANNTSTIEILRAHFYFRDDANHTTSQLLWEWELAPYYLEIRDELIVCYYYKFICLQNPEITNKMKKSLIEAIEDHKKSLIP